MFRGKLIILIAFMANALWATGITFTFENIMITRASGLMYYEFDVMAQADQAGTRIGDNQVYINYNTLGFGTNVAANGKITVEKGTLLSGELVAGLPLYGIVQVVDNADSRFAVTVEYKYPDSPGSANELLTTPEQLLHIKIEIADSNQTAGISFEEALMVGQQYQSDNSTKYSPVVATDTDDSPLDDTPSAVEQNGQVVPDRFYLYSNYPNPFNPSTTLKFDLPQNVQNVRLVIYDILGRQVAVLYSGSLMAGRYTYIWNGQNQFGAPMPTGVYFASFKADNYSKTIKMMLVK
ncbi:FlgD immunoglobulin-like domain containing protein [Caldithrix abyssi]